MSRAPLQVASLDPWTYPVQVHWSKPKLKYIAISVIVRLVFDNMLAAPEGFNEIMDGGREAGGNADVGTGSCWIDIDEADFLVYEDDGYQGPNAEAFYPNGSVTYWVKHYRYENTNRTSLYNAGFMDKTGNTYLPDDYIENPEANEVTVSGISGAFDWEKSFEPWRWMAGFDMGETFPPPRFVGRFLEVSGSPVLNDDGDPIGNYKSTLSVDFKVMGAPLDGTPTCFRTLPASEHPVSIPKAGLTLPVDPLNGGVFNPWLWGAEMERRTLSVAGLSISYKGKTFTPVGVYTNGHQLVEILFERVT